MSDMSGDTDDRHLRIRDDPERLRYEAHVPGTTDVATLHYRWQDERIVFTHTEVPAPLEGHGVGTTLARHALDDARRRGLAVVPRCPFVAAFIRRHPDYLDLVPEGLRTTFGLPRGR